MAKVLLEYLFFFDPVNTWQHLSQFEGDFAKFLIEHGMEAEFVNAINGGNGRRVVLIKKKENFVPNIVSKSGQPPQISIKEQIARVMPQDNPKISEKATKFKKGRFLRTKGYLKK